MAWYDVFSRFYDASLEDLYREPRGRMAEVLPARIDAALVLPAGTGQDLPFLVHRLSEQGRVLAVDRSPGMLARCAERVAAQGWEEQVVVHEADAATLTPSGLQEVLGRGAVDAILVSLGPSVFEDWEGLFQATAKLLEPGGTYVIFDAYAERWVPQTTIVQCMAGADLRRRAWETLEHGLVGVQRQWLPGSVHTFGGRLYVASGRRPTSAP